MFVVVNALYDVNFTVLNVEMSDTVAGSLATDEHMASSLRLSRKRARRLMEENKSVDSLQQDWNKLTASPWCSV
jgi:hypothetical protein